MVSPSLLPEYNAMNAKQAAEKALNLGKQLQAVIDVGEVLNEIGDLESARKNAEDQAQDAIDAAEQALDDLKAIQDSLSSAKADLAAAKAEAIKTRDEAIVAHDHMIAVARAERDNMIRKATDSSNALVERAKSEIDGMENRRDGLLKEITDNQKAVTNLENQMRALKDRLG